MGRVGLLLLNGRAPHVVEPQHQVRIAGKALWRGDVLDLVLLPQAASRAEGIDPAFGADSRAGQDHDIANLCHGFSLARSP